MKKKQLGIEQKYLAEDLPGNLIVIIYSKKGQQNVVDLVNMLKNQKYPKENYQIHVIFDNVLNEYPDIVEKLGNVKVWRINKGVTMGKDNALSWLLERLISFRNVNAFVFLDSDRIIKDDFLSNINIALFSNDIIIPAKEYFVSKGDIVSAVQNLGLKYYNRIFNSARAVLKLICPIDSGAVAIKQEVLEKMQCVDFKDKRNEYMYSLFLASKGFIPVFAPDVRTKIYFGSENHLSLSDKFSIFKYGCSKLLSGNLKILEFLTGFFRFPVLMVLFLYLAFYMFLYNFEVKNMFFYDVFFLNCSLWTLIIFFICSLVVCSDEKINPFLLILFPIYKVLDILFPIRNTNQQQEKEHFDNPEILMGTGEDVFVSDGQNVLKCSIEIKNTGEGKRVFFRYKEKIMQSEVYESAKLAIEEISTKLLEKGLKLQICATCAHFGFKPNTDVSVQTGLCSQKDNMTGDIRPQKNILESCPHFILMNEINNVVDISIKKEEE
jgi:hypothetical protein